MEGKDNIKRAAYQIKIFAASKAAPENYDSDTSAKVPCNKKARTSVLPECKHQGKKTPNNKGPHI